MLLQTLFCTLLFANFVLSIPPNDKALFDDDNPEARGHKRRRPCRGWSPDGRTFFDWNLHYVDVNYNYNYNINCGGGGGSPHGGGGGGGPQKPILSGIGSGGSGGGGPQKPILSGLLQGVGNAISGDDAGGGGGSLLGSGINFVQTQVQNVLANPPDLTSFFPQDSGSNGGGFFNGGLFNGQGVLSLFENGLFSGIFDNRPANPGSVRPPSPPPRPPPNVPNRPPPSAPNRPPVNVPSRPQTTTPDPDDIIYNDDRPVYEPHDDVLPDQYNRPAPLYTRPRPSRPYQYQGYRSNSNRIRFT